MVNSEETKGATSQTGNCRLAFDFVVVVVVSKSWTTFV
jgi:hypothetical protein